MLVFIIHSKKNLKHNKIRPRILKVDKYLEQKGINKLYIKLAREILTKYL
jgi:hypothetical protein